MPTFKHPCPYCDKFIDRVVAACPFCGQVEPFAPKRCQNCRKIVDDPAWTVCPGCGMSLMAPPPGHHGARRHGDRHRRPGASSGPAGQPVRPIGPPATGPPSSRLRRHGRRSRRTPPRRCSSRHGPCGGCGAPLPAGAHFCTICGTVAG